MQELKIRTIISKNQQGKRLDKALAQLFPLYSRSLIKKWICNYKVMVNGIICYKPKNKVFGGESIYIDAEIENKTSLKPQNIPLNIVYEDDHILIINKPRNFVVNIGAGNFDGTLINALLHYYPPIIDVPNKGIVHRLDKDTTGLMLIAKTINAHKILTESIKLRNIIREYEGIVIGHITAGGTINEPIKRHPIKRKHMSVHPMGKTATTHYRIIEYFRWHTSLRLRLETGRTHQIRVHLAYINHPLVGDKFYGGYKRLPKKEKITSDIFIKTLLNFDRQALHASMLQFYHPISGLKIKLHASIPQDMIELIDIMRIDVKNNIN